MGLFSSTYGKVFNTVGNALNDITGASSAAKQSQRYALQSAAINNQYQKEFAQNAHQWEIADLQKAGLNPVLSAGGSGASASGGGVNSASMTASGINPIETAIGAWNGIENAKNTGAQTNKTEAETQNEITRNENIKADTLLKKRQALEALANSNLSEEKRKQVLAEIRKTDAEIIKINAETQKTYTEEENLFEESQNTRGGLLTKITGTAPLQRGKARKTRALRNR